MDEVVVSYFTKKQMRQREIIAGQMIVLYKDDDIDVGSQRFWCDEMNEVVVSYSQTDETERHGRMTDDLSPQELWWRHRLSILKDLV